jgi:two-component system cell cycle sensor histidine kinase PleC
MLNGIFETPQDIQDPTQKPRQPLLLPTELEDRALLLAHMGRWRWALNERDVLFSHNLYEIFDLDTSRFTASLNMLRTLISTRDLGRIFITVNRLIQEGQEGVIDFVMKHPARNDRDYHVRCYACAERHPNGQIVALYGFLQDISREKRNQAALQHALEETEAANRAKSRFLATMSHELRTPLNAIIGFSEMMNAELLGPLGSKRYVDYAGSINESGRYLLDLINDILDMSKIEAGKYELVHEPVNVVKAIRLSCHMVENTVQDKGLNLTLVSAHDGYVIEADRRAFMQIMLNLLSNAAKFTNTGGAISITVAESDGDRIAITVTDTGIGIPSDKLHRIGQPFEQVSSATTRSHGGTGLGLAITKKLVEMHEGDLRIESVLGKGTSVTLSMPAISKQKQYDLFNSTKRQSSSFEDGL